MLSSYIIQYTCDSSHITKQLIPWNKYMNYKEFQINEKINNTIIGTVIKHIDKYYIITAYNIDVLYSDCHIILENKTVKLNISNYCYFMKLISFIIDDDPNNDEELINHMKHNSIELDDLKLTLSNIENSSYYLSLYDDFYKLPYIKISQESTNNIYPLIWLKTEVEDHIIDDVYNGSPIISEKSNSIFGIVFENNENQIKIIPTIAIHTLLVNYELYNIFFDYKLSTDNKMIIYRSYTNNLSVDDEIIKINNQKLNQTIYSSELDIKVDIHTYLWYSNDRTHYFQIKRKDKNNIIDIKIGMEKLSKKLSINVSDTITSRYVINKNVTRYLENKNGLLFCALNLLMLEWSQRHNIIFKNSKISKYNKDPFEQTNNNYVCIGVKNLQKQNINIQNTLKEYDNNYLFDIKTFTSTKKGKVVNTFDNNILTSFKKFKEFINMSISDIKLEDNSNSIIALNWTS